MEPSDWRTAPHHLHRSTPYALALGIRDRLDCRGGAAANLPPGQAQVGL